MPLQYSPNVEEEFRFLVIGGVASGLNFLIFLGSLPVDSFVGLQVAIPAQLMFYSSVTLAFRGSEVVAYTSLRYGDGFHDVITDYPLLYAIGNSFSSMNIYEDYFWNFNVMLGLLLVVAGICIFLKAIEWHHQNKLRENKDSKKMNLLFNQSKYRARSFFNNFFKPLLMALSLRILLANSLAMLPHIRERPYPGIFDWLMVLSLSLAFMLILLIPLFSSVITNQPTHPLRLLEGFFFLYLFMMGLAILTFHK